ncbi:hypothetical protein BDV95DRAFT_593610 [Massariosphaeria phaeospora]|uniref:Uncharacterized protein n=1 Tax=Massariosphaeria phaeospora TaxID=100035 RepID=A0A7C8I8D6_9PLEO|nr:hypothetical protein BDV95DRAFT_593610 [Massariosphaeria phaeospora]
MSHDRWCIFLHAETPAQLSSARKNSALAHAGGASSTCCNVRFWARTDAPLCCCRGVPFWMGRGFNAVETPSPVLCVVGDSPVHGNRSPSHDKPAQARPQPYTAARELFKTVSDGLAFFCALKQQLQRLSRFDTSAIVPHGTQIEIKTFLGHVATCPMVLRSFKCGFIGDNARHTNHILTRPTRCRASGQSRHSTALHWVATKTSIISTQPHLNGLRTPSSLALEHVSSTTAWHWGRHSYAASIRPRYEAS